MRRRSFLHTLAAAGAYGALGPGCAGPGRTDVAGRRTARLDQGWRFLRQDSAGAAAPGLDDAAWETATLPHTARIEALVTGEPGSDTYQWQGVCWYRRRLTLGDDVAGRKVFLHFEAAMNVADVFLDGEPLGRHEGGFLPFVFDLTDRITPGTESVLAVRLDNTDDPVTGPKPLEILDFNLYHGLYRYVHLTVKDRLHITDPILADRPASGGVFITFPEVSVASALVRVQTHVRNDHPDARTFRVRSRLTGPGGAAVADLLSDPVTLDAGADREVVQEIRVTNPLLWSPRTPHLHVVDSAIVQDGAVIDAERTRIGIRRIEITEAGFRINGESLFLRGTNRHQEYPYLGYAVPADAHFRDARHIKDAGFDFIRLSHYPHSTAFMDACDELGLVVMNCIPGWQYFGDDPAFAEGQYRNCRDLVRRDRNHPCVILWEVSLNETGMPAEFIERTHAIAHEEYPGDPCYTCGWMRGYDVFIRARQHGGCRGVEGVPCLVSEYGDWEYYAMTAGLDQHAWSALSPDESNSRQLRWQGERAQLQQAANFQEAHADNRSTAAFADGLWVMFDYNRGYAPDIESSGCMDIFRLPKYAYRLFRSQRPADEHLEHADSGPMVFIASEWTPSSPTDIRVFSNCEEVELVLNGGSVGRRAPEAVPDLAHPPFVFRLGAFTPGTLEAVGYIGGREAARHRVTTPGAIEQLTLEVVRAGRPPRADGLDALFAHASLRDARGTVVADAWENVAFGVTGGAERVGADPFSSDAGIASTVIRTQPGSEYATVYALAIVRAYEGSRVLGAAAGVFGDPAPFEVRCTRDGTRPGPGSPVYAGPLRTDAASVRAALVVGGAVVTELDGAAARFRLRGSAAPDRREPWRHG